MKNSLFKATLLLVSVWISVIVFAKKEYTKPVLQTGIWKGLLKRPDGYQIIFNFTMLKQKSRLVLYVQNADERLLVDSIVQKGDSLWIQMPFFASRFALKIKANGNLEGNYIKSYGNKQQEIPFTAIYGNATRYPAVRKPLYNLSGRWAVTFEGKNDLATKAVGEFKQTKNGTITGTFLTPTGDYRYLEGIINADSVQLSAFDGGHAILFTAKLKNDSTISQAVLYNGLTGKQSWTAIRNE